MGKEMDFSDEEESYIHGAALALAKDGDEAVWNATSLCLKMKIASHASDGLPILFTFNNVAIVMTPTELRRDADILREIVRRAKPILQFEGKDSLSQLDRDSIIAGWGSVHDPESRISKALGSFLRS
jgi:hypothetical protein